MTAFSGQLFEETTSENNISLLDFCLENLLSDFIKVEIDRLEAIQLTSIKSIFFDIGKLEALVYRKDLTVKKDTMETLESVLFYDNTLVLKEIDA